MFTVNGERWRTTHAYRHTLCPTGHGTCFSDGRLNKLSSPQPLPPALCPAFRHKLLSMSFQPFSSPSFSLELSLVECPNFYYYFCFSHKGEVERGRADSEAHRYCFWCTFPIGLLIQGQTVGGGWGGVGGWIIPLYMVGAF